MATLQFKKDWLLEKLKILSSFTISSVILINCYGYLLNNTIKTSKNNKTVHNPQPVKQEYIKKTEETDNAIIDLQSLDTLDEEDIIDSFSESLENNIDLKISTDLAVYDEMVKLGVIIPEFTTEEKINWILENYHLTMDQYKTIVGVVLAEGGDYNYEECYAVINTIYNRSICSRWVESVNKGQGEGLGRSLYNQVIQKGQFTVYFYKDRTFQLYVNETPETSPGAKAVVDFLFGTFTRNEETWELEWNGPARLHDTLNFVGYYVIPSYEYYLYTSRGNNHGVHMKESEYLTKQFTSTTEEEVEKEAVKAKEYCQEYKKAISSGLSHDKALSLARNKIS